MKLYEASNKHKYAFLVQRGSGYRVVLIDIYFEKEYEHYFNNFIIAKQYIDNWITYES